MPRVFSYSLTLFSYHFPIKERFWFFLFTAMLSANLPSILSIAIHQPSFWRRLHVEDFTTLLRICKETKALKDEMRKGRTTEFCERIERSLEAALPRVTRTQMLEVRESLDKGIKGLQIYIGAKRLKPNKIEVNNMVYILEDMVACFNECNEDMVQLTIFAVMYKKRAKDKSFRNNAGAISALMGITEEHWGKYLTKEVEMRYATLEVYLLLNAAFAGIPEQMHDTALDISMQLYQKWPAFLDEVGPDTGFWLTSVAILIYVLETNVATGFDTDTRMPHIEDRDKLTKMVRSIHRITY